jgi:hypothetical protein
VCSLSSALAKGTAGGKRLSGNLELEAHLRTHHVIFLN